MQDTTFDALLAAMVHGEHGFTVEVPADWLQGRTAYGGLSAALCFEAAQRQSPDLPPLRSAQFAFVGPASGILTATPAILRQGKSTTFVGVDLSGEAGLAVRGLLCFGANRNSALDHWGLPAPEAVDPETCPPFFSSPERPGFAHHFDGRLAAGARPRTPGADPDMLVWMRHRDPAPSLTGFIALADALPPAAIVLFPAGMRPISTMTWTIDLLSDAPASLSGWWLIHNVAQNAASGCSAQDMTIWNDRREPVAAMRQTVAVFA
ncbi:thioesterase family protein (plasmid) [Polymorphobacter sp. PAMC 29334]|uniref:acyl-CoA thioesterase n=1 Tax=Polymorphobacter sp. PAMC 29334 TaxID=2862331 RepID=UPI001C68037B|nr:thioesterase family protein [Polymorphobacter sp. PAMC 29334]QYE32967.1 thioesterase family protein [Polymorphobacter sp. PAMC 29334]